MLVHTDLDFNGRNQDLIYRAGMIPYFVESDGSIQMLFMIPSNYEYGGKCFQIAKGKVESEDTSFYNAALREAKEELGLFSGNIISAQEVGMILGRTALYVAKVKNKDLFGLPSDETLATKWMSLSEFKESEGRDLHKPIVSQCHRLIQKIEFPEED